MGICKMYFHIATRVASSPLRGKSKPLDELLRLVVRSHTSVSDATFATMSLTAPRQIPAVASAEEGAREWYPSYQDWDKNSGSLPASLFGNEGLEVVVEGGRLKIGSIFFSVGLIHHKRNGTFVLVQAGPFD